LPSAITIEIFNNVYIIRYPKPTQALRNVMCFAEGMSTGAMADNDEIPCFAQRL
jgi:hypothetical protein